MAVDVKRDEIRKELQSRLNKIAVEENKKIDESNSSKATFVTGLAAIMIIWIFFNIGFGFFFIILSAVAIGICFFIYNVLSKETIYPDSVTDSQVTNEYKKFIKSLTWYSDEISEATKLANAMNNGKLSIFPNTWFRKNNLINSFDILLNCQLKCYIIGGKWYYYLNY